MKSVNDALFLGDKKPIEGMMKIKGMK